MDANQLADSPCRRCACIRGGLHRTHIAPDDGGDEAGIDLEKINWIIDLKTKRRGRIAEYVQQFKTARYFEGQRPWNVPADLALPCATQNEIALPDAQAILKAEF